MKQLLYGFCVAITLGVFSLRTSANTYYSKTSGFANQFTTWGTNSDGSGTAPLNFTTPGDIFILTSQSTLGLNGQWTIGANVTLQVDGNIAVTYNNHDINISGTVIFTNPNSTQVSLTGGGNGNSFIVSAAATVKTANVNGLRGQNCSLPSNVSGSINFNANADYAFIGQANQSTTGLPGQVRDLFISNVNGLELLNSVTLSGTLNLQNGILDIAPGVTVTVNSPSSIVGSGYGNSKHINTRVNGSNMGYLRVNSINGMATLPIGNGTYYLPVTIVSSTSTDISVNVFQGVTTNGQPNGTPLSVANKTGLVDAVWTLQRMAGNSAVLLTLNWPQALEGSGFSAYGNSEIGIARNLGTYWDLPIGSGSQVANTATLSSVSTLGAFGVGKVGIPLPLKFGGVKLNGNTNSVQVTWNTLSEYNVAGYDIERSKDGRSFEKIGDVAALVDNSSSHIYNWIDALPLSGNSFYRIKARDIDGKETFSAVVRISMASFDGIEMTVYPNPALSKELTVQAMGLDKGIFHLTLRDMSGRIVYKQDIKHSGGSISEHVILPAAINSGVYNLSLDGSFGGIQRKVRIQ